MITIGFTITAGAHSSHQVDCIDAETASSADIASVWARLNSYDPKEAIKRTLIDLCHKKGIDPGVIFGSQNPEQS